MNSAITVHAPATAVPSHGSSATATWWVNSNQIVAAVCPATTRRRSHTCGRNRTSGCPVTRSRVCPHHGSPPGPPGRFAGASGAGGAV
jgi:hypothetical protein